MKVYNKHFDSQYSKTFGAPLDIIFVIYSQRIWNSALDIIKNGDRVVDLGCGSGTLLYNLLKSNKKIDLYGMDLSGVICKRTKQWLPETTIICGDILNTSFKYNSFDVVFSTMVIEHIDDKQFLKEVNRILRKDGFFVCTTVLKNKNAWYFIKNAKGERVLEKTHLREYKSINEFTNLLKQESFTIHSYDTLRIKYPIIDPILKLLHNIFKSEFFRDFPAHHLNKIRKITRIRIPGYYSIEVIAKKL